MATRREQLEAANARYENWATDTSNRRDAAGKARAELERRELARQVVKRHEPESEGEPPTMVQWWRQLEADLAAVDRAIEHEDQAVIAEGKSWPPQHESEPVRGPESSPGSGPQADGQPGPDDQTATFGKLLAQAAETAKHFAAERLTGKPEPSTPLALNEKPTQKPSAPRKPKPPMRQRSSCNNAGRAMTVLASRPAILRVHLTTRLAGDLLAGVGEMPDVG